MAPYTSVARPLAQIHSPSSTRALLTGGDGGGRLGKLNKSPIKVPLLFAPASPRLESFRRVSSGGLLALMAHERLFATECKIRISIQANGSSVHPRVSRRTSGDEN